MNIRKTILIFSICMCIMICFTSCGTDSLDGQYNVVCEKVYLGGGGDGDGYDADTTGMSVTISGIEDSDGKSGTITLNRDGDIYTGKLKDVLKNDEDYDAHFEVNWKDDNAPEVTANPFGYSAGSTNTESSYLYVDDNEIKLHIIWMYSHLLYYNDSSDIYTGTDDYLLEKVK